MTWLHENEELPQEADGADEDANMEEQTGQEDDELGTRLHISCRDFSKVPLDKVCS